jgi:hypothetical protein
MNIFVSSLNRALRYRNWPILFIVRTSSFASVPPTKAELVGYSGGAQLVVQDGADVELTCRVHDAKPKPDIIWYLGGVEISQGKPCGRSLFYTVIDFKALLGIRIRIQIRRISMFSGLPDPDLLVRGRIRIRLWILPFSHKSVERTEIIVQNKIERKYF